MRNLLNFLIKYSTWFVFTFFVLLSLILLIKSNSYQLSVYLTTANGFNSSINKATSGISGYFNLRKTNDMLLKQNAELENKILNLQYELKSVKALEADSFSFTIKPRFNFVSASVINNNTRHTKNYFTINKGSNDGLEPGMGVIDHNGIVGIVNVVGKNTSRVISVLTQGQVFSVKLKDSPFVGALTWKGQDPNTAYMEEVAKHSKLRIGDTIVTSGFSTTFPEGIPVGRVVARIKGYDDNFLTFKIRLFSDFKKLETVNIIKDSFKAELDSLSSLDKKDE